MPATPIINARTNSSGLLELSNFIFCAGINQAALLPIGDDIRAIRRSNPKKIVKKGEKKLVRALRVPLEGTSSDKHPHFVVQKKFKKVKKKLVRALEF
jgi:hypothetical protein